MTLIVNGQDRLQRAKGTNPIEGFQGPGRGPKGPLWLNRAKQINGSNYGNDYTLMKIMLRDHILYVVPDTLDQAGRAYRNGDLQRELRL